MLKEPRFRPQPNMVEETRCSMQFPNGICSSRGRHDRVLTFSRNSDQVGERHLSEKPLHGQVPGARSSFVLSQARFPMEAFAQHRESTRDMGDLKDEDMNAEDGPRCSAMITSKDKICPCGV